MIGYLFLCFISILTGRGILRLIGVRVESNTDLYLGPVITLAFWAIFLGWGVVLGFAIKHLWLLGWILTFLLALNGLVRVRDTLRTTKWFLLFGVVMIPCALMAPYFLHGLHLYMGSCFWDGWSYAAFGQYLWEYPRGTEGGLAPIFQYAYHLSYTRFIGPSFLAFFSPIFGSIKDTQAASGYFLSWTLFVFSSSCMYFIQTLDKNRAKWLWFVYVSIAAFSGWILNMLIVTNYDNALLISILPASAAIIYSLDPRNWRWTIVLGVLAAAGIFCYPEMMIAVFVGFFLFFLQRILSEKQLIKAFSIFIGITIVIGFLFSLPYIKLFITFVHAQSQFALGKSAVRPGGGFFLHLLKLSSFLSAFWGFIAPYDSPVNFVKIWKYIIQNVHGIFLSCLALLGLFNLFRRKLWGIGTYIIFLLWAMLIMILKWEYAYGAYKLILLNWWGISYIVLSGVSVLISIFRNSKYRLVIYAPFVVLFLTYNFVMGKRIFDFDKRFVSLKDSMILRQVQEIKNRVGEDTVFVKVNDDYNHCWAIYYLRNMNIYLSDYHIYMAQPHVVPLMERAKKVDFSEVRYLLTDNQEDLKSFSMDLIWTGGPFRLWEFKQKKFVLSDTLINPNGIEVWNGEQGFWMGQGETKLRLLSTYNGQACLKGHFSRGPSLSEKSMCRIIISTDQGYERQITIEKGGVQEYSIPVVKGINWVSMKSLDEQSVRVAHDPRPLLVGVSGLTIVNNEKIMKEKTE